MPDISTIGADGKLAFPIRFVEKIVDDVSTLEPLIWAYHTPISRAVFEANYRVIAAANMTIFSKGTGFAAESGPIIATLALRDAARQDAQEFGVETTGDPATPILAEIERLTLVLAPSSQGYEMLPISVALGRGVIDAEDWAEAQSSLVFFTCGSWMTRRERREMKRSALASVLRGSITSLPPTEFAASLRPSMPTAPSTVPAPSLIPS